MTKTEALVDTLVDAVIEWTESLHAKGERPQNRAPATRDDLLSAIRAIEAERDAAVARERAIIQALGGEQDICEGRDPLEFARSIATRCNDRGDPEMSSSPRDRSSGATTSSTCSSTGCRRSTDQVESPTTPRTRS